MKRQLLAQTVASTSLDSQGEQLSREELAALLRGIPSRIPLHQQHDFSLPVCGEMTNFRIESDLDGSNLQFLVCDVSYDDELVDLNIMRAFSWSATRGLLSNSEEPEFGIYLPFPHYNNDALLDSIAKCDSPLVVGKWLKKSAEPWLVALIVIVVLPFWVTAYKKLLEDKVGKLIDELRARWPKGMSTNVSTDVPTQLYSPRPAAILLPPPGEGLEWLRTVGAGIERAKAFCEADFEKNGKHIRRLKAIYDPQAAAYRIFGVEYDDGSHIAIDEWPRERGRATDEGLIALVDVDEQAYAVHLNDGDDIKHTLRQLKRSGSKAKMSSAKSNATSVDIGILTIRNDEFRAILKVFPGTQVVRGRRHYNLTTAEAGDSYSYSVAILRQLEQGNGEALDAARDMIEELQPRLLLVVGIAGGVPHDDFTLGDVVVSTRVNDYCVEARKEGESPSYNLSGGPVDKEIAAGVVNLPAVEHQLGDWTTDLPERPRLDIDCLQIVGPEGWQKQVCVAIQRHFGNSADRLPLFMPGILASSNILVKDPNVLFPWIETARHILAVDMESAGAYRAACGRVPMVAIRGISDIIGLQRDDRWTKYACASAAAFARAYLRTTPIQPTETPTPQIDPATLAEPIPSPVAKARGCPIHG